MKVIVKENEDELTSELMKLIESCAKKSIAEHDIFRVGVSGGSLVKFLSNGLRGVDTDFTKWKIFFCDERLVPVESPDSTFGLYKKELVGKTEIKEDQFITIKQGLPADEAALDYIQKMALYFPPNCVPEFDLLLLGMGPDGHTCSLFPGHKLLGEDIRWVAPIIDSPKPPPERITLTYPIINNATCCIFAVSGESKKNMVKRILVDKEDLPAGRVKPTNGSLYWILDKAAGKLLK